MSFSSKFYSLDKKVLLNQTELNILSNNQQEPNFEITEPKPKEISNYNPSNYHNKFCNINDNNINGNINDNNINGNINSNNINSNNINSNNINSNNINSNNINENINNKFGNLNSCSDYSTINYKPSDYINKISNNNFISHIYERNPNPLTSRIPYVDLHHNVQTQKGKFLLRNNMLNKIDDIAHFDENLLEDLYCKYQNKSKMELLDTL